MNKKQANRHSIEFGGYPSANYSEQAQGIEKALVSFLTKVEEVEPLSTLPSAPEVKPSRVFTLATLLNTLVIKKGEIDFWKNIYKLIENIINNTSITLLQSGKISDTTSVYTFNEQLSDDQLSYLLDEIKASYGDDITIEPKGRTLHITRKKIFIKTMDKNAAGELEPIVSPYGETKPTTIVDQFKNPIPTVEKTISDTSKTDTDKSNEEVDDSDDKTDYRSKDVTIENPILERKEIINNVQKYNKQYIENYKKYENSQNNILTTKCNEIKNVLNSMINDFNQYVRLEKQHKINNKLDILKSNPEYIRLEEQLSKKIQDIYILFSEFDTIIQINEKHTEISNSITNVETELGKITTLLETYGITIMPIVYKELEAKIEKIVIAGGEFINKPNITEEEYNNIKFVIKNILNDMNAFATLFKSSYMESNNLIYKIDNKKKEFNDNKIDITTKELKPLMDRVDIINKKQEDGLYIEVINLATTLLDELIDAYNKINPASTTGKTITIPKHTTIFSFEDDIVMQQIQTEEVTIIEELEFSYIFENGLGDKYLVLKRDLRSKQLKYRIKKNEVIVDAKTGITLPKLEIPIPVKVLETRKYDMIVEDARNSNRVYRVKKEQLEARASLKKDALSFRDFPESGDMDIQVGKIQEGVADRWSPGTGTSYLSMPNTGDVAREVAKGKAGDAQTSESETIETKPLTEDEFKIQTYKQLLEGAIQNNESVALIEYYKERIIQHETNKPN